MDQAILFKRWTSFCALYCSDTEVVVGSLLSVSSTATLIGKQSQYITVPRRKPIRCRPIVKQTRIITVQVRGYMLFEDNL